MNRQSRRSSCSTYGWAIHVGLLGLISVMTMAGCSEHRMSLADFLTLERQMQEAAKARPPDESVPISEPLIERQLGPYRVGPSDVLGVVFTGTDETGFLPFIKTRVDRKGEIDLPIVGTLKIGDMELEDIEDAIHRAYVPSVVKDVAIHVELVSPNPTNILVVGAVTVPGLVQLRWTERNLLHAIVAAGGVSDLASGQATLRRLRGSDEELTLDLTDPRGIKAALSLAPLENGDIVTIHAATPNMVFVGGLVNAPQAQAYPNGVNVTVLQAIAASAGLRTDVTPREATLIRRMADGGDLQVKLNLDRINVGKDPNIQLAAGDILWVPDTFMTKAQDWFNRNIYFRAGVAASVSYNVSGIEYMNRQRQQSGGSSSGSSLQDQFDPFGYLARSAALQSLSSQAAAP